MTVRVLISLLVALSASSPAPAQRGPLPVIAVPPFTIRQSEVNDTGSLAMQAAQVIASDLRSSGDVVPLGPDVKTVYTYPEVTAPNFAQWRRSGARFLVTGFVTNRADGRLAIGCYVYDIAAGRELGRQGFVVAAADWRRAAHRCSDTAYAKATDRPGWFDSRVAYVAESGPPTSPIKRIAVMDSDGTSHRFLTAGDSIVLSPAMARSADRIAFVAFTAGRPRVHIADLPDGAARPLLPDDAISFAPAFSPDGQSLLLSIARGGNTDIFAVKLDGSAQRLTSTPGTDTAASYSPDGTQILFESDRSGGQQLYVMNSDGSNQRRLSFGFGRYAAPAWSPDGQLIAFTRIAGDGARIGVMNADGREEKILTAGPHDEAPSWATSSRHLLFQRGNPASGRNGLFIVGSGGGGPTQLITPQGASDAEWSAGGTG